MIDRRCPVCDSMVKVRYAADQWSRPCFMEFLKGHGVCYGEPHVHLKCQGCGWSKVRTT